MSGHSKWSTIKHKKAITDAKRSAIFGKLARSIIVAARRGGGDPETNYTLRGEIERAKQANMPKDKIENAIRKGTGEIQGVQIEELQIEAFGPGGVALLINTITDSRNRATAEVRHILEKHGGKIAGPGSARWAFQRKEKEKGKIEWEAQTKMDISDQDKQKLQRLYEELDGHDDVQEVYSNEK